VTAGDAPNILHIEPIALQAGLTGFTAASIPQRARRTPRPQTAQAISLREGFKTDRGYAIDRPTRPRNPQRTSGRGALATPDCSYRRERGERRVLLRQRLWRNPSTFRFDSVYHLSFCVRFAKLLALLPLCVLCGELSGLDGLSPPALAQCEFENRGATAKPMVILSTARAPARWPRDRTTRRPAPRPRGAWHRRRYRARAPGWFRKSQWCLPGSPLTAVR